MPNEEESTRTTPLLLNEDYPTSKMVMLDKFRDFARPPQVENL
jgi:hypothetical protein